MALQTKYNFGFPTKGINRAVARSNQPQDTAWDMLNVLPFDGTGRLRGAKRRGTEKLWDTPLGVDTDNVVLLDQVTLVTAAQSEVDPVVAFSDDFTYSNGELHSVSSGLWNQYDAGTGITATFVQVASDAAVLPVSGSSREAIFRPATTPSDIDLAVGYEWKANVTLGAGAGSGGNEFGINLETDDTNWLIGSLTANISINLTSGSVTIQCDSGPTSVTVTSGTGIVRDVPFALKISVGAGAGTRSCTVTVDGVDMTTFALGVNAGAAVSENFLIDAICDVGSGNYVKVDDVVYQNPGADGDGIATRSTKIVAVANRDIYIGDIATQGTLVTDGENVIAKSIIPQGCYSAGKYFFVDGGDIKQLDLATGAMDDYAASAGDAPTGVTVCCIWRDRLVVGGPDQNVYFSRVGVHDDWDYGKSDPAAAFAANSSESGHIGEPVVSLMPLSDDLLGIGGDHNLWIVRGDPAAGGSIDEVSNAIGVFSAKSWTKSPDGTVYFVGTGGLYRWTPNSRQNPLPECISLASYNQFFTALDRSRIIPSLAWDRDNHGMYCFFYRTGADIEGAPVHLWYDERLDSLFPLQLPIDQGPICSLVYDGDGPSDRVLLLAGRDGYIRKLDTAAGPLSDDGDAINGYVVFPTFTLGDANNDEVIGRVNVSLGEPDGTLSDMDFSVLLTVRAGDSAYDATEGTNPAFYRTASRLYSGEFGRLTPFRQRLRGSFGMVRLEDNSADKTFSFETLSVDTESAGSKRK